MKMVKANVIREQYNLYIGIRAHISMSIEDGLNVHHCSYIRACACVDVHVHRCQSAYLDLSSALALCSTAFSPVCVLQFLICILILLRFLFRSCSHVLDLPLLPTSAWTIDYAFASESVPRCPIVADFCLFLTLIFLTSWCYSVEL